MDTSAGSATATIAESDPITISISGPSNVGEGDAVADGDVVAVLDAMKMEHAITAPGAGTVRAVHVARDEVVEAGTLLLELE